MTAKEKAKDLINRMTVDMSIDKWQVKQCALIAVDEMVCNLTDLCCEFGGNDTIENDIKYWQEVKNEIELL